MESSRHFERMKKNLKQFSQSVSVVFEIKKKCLKSRFFQKLHMNEKKPKKYNN